MKVHKTITLDNEVVEALKDLNASELINSLLRDYLDTHSGIEQVKKHNREAKIIEETKKKMEEQQENELRTTELRKIEAFSKEMSEDDEMRAEYLQGIKENKWRSIREFYEHKNS